MTKKIHFLILLVLPIASSSCQNIDNEDFSKTTEEYYSLGISNLNKKWTEDELDIAYSVIEKLKKENAFSLPRINSSKSSPIFNKIIEQLSTFENYIFTTYDNFRIEANYFTKQFFTLKNIYGTNKIEEKYFSAECLEIESKILIGFTNQTLIYLDEVKNSRQYTNESIAEKVDKMAEFIADVYVPSLRFCKDRTGYKTEDKIKFSSVFSNNLIKIWNELKEKQIMELTSELEKISNESKIPQIRVNFKELLKKLK